MSAKAFTCTNAQETPTAGRIALLDKQHELIPVRVVAHGVLTERGLTTQGLGVVTQPLLHSVVYLPQARLRHLPTIYTAVRPYPITLGHYGGLPAEYVLAEISYIPRKRLNYALYWAPVEATPKAIRLLWQRTLLERWIPKLGLLAVRYAVELRAIEKGNWALRLFGLDYQLRRRLKRAGIHDMRMLARWLSELAFWHNHVALADGGLLGRDEQIELIACACAFLGWQLLT